MGRKIKISYEDKLKACEDYINGIASSKQIAERLNLSSGGDRDVLWWVMKYRANGPESLMPKPKNSSYTKEFKIKTVEEYLSGSGSQEDICNKYQIPSTRTLRQWIAKYNDLEELKDYIPKPEVYTKMARRKTTQEEREEIVKYCIEHDNDYKSTAAVYDVSYSEVERLQRQNKILQARIKELEMEAVLLKKVEEIERRRSSQKRKTK